MTWRRGDRVVVTLLRKHRHITQAGQIVAFGLVRGEVEGAIVRLDRGAGRPLPKPPGCSGRSTTLGLFPLGALGAV